MPLTNPKKEKLVGERQAVKIIMAMLIMTAAIQIVLSVRPCQI